MITTAPEPLAGYPGVAYTVDRRSLGVRPACPRCPWRSNVGVVAGSYKWRQWVALAVRQHTCTNPDQEKPA